MLIGLLTVRCEHDILAETLPLHLALCDRVYTLDSTDAPTADRDGVRQMLLDQAYRDHGHDHWFLLLHADEVWRCDPRDLAAAHPGADGFRFRLPLCFNPAGWNDHAGVLDQASGRLLPGWREFRMFHGAPHVRFDPAQHFNVQPRGLARVVDTAAEIDHYPYRSTASQLARKAATWDPDNYQDAPLAGPAIPSRFLGRSDAYTSIAVRA